MNYRDEYKAIERDAFWTMPRAFLGLLVFVIAIYAIGFVATGGDLAIYRFWAPKQENARRVVFENTQSYVQGKIGHLSTLRLQYEQADSGSASKAALRTMILTEASTIDNDKLPVDLQSFVQRIRGER